MAKFRFRLEAVLMQREAAERERQLEVAALEQQRYEMEEQVRSCQREIVREKEEMRAQLAGGGGVKIDLRGVRLQAGTSLRLMAQAQRTVLKLAGLHRRIETARARLLEAATARKAVELLRERRLEEWMYEQKQIEARATDELAVIKASRTSGEDEL